MPSWNSVEVDNYESKPKTPVQVMQPLQFGNVSMHTSESEKE